MRFLRIFTYGTILKDVSIKPNKVDEIKSNKLQLYDCMRSCMIIDDKIQCVSYCTKKDSINRPENITPSG